MSAEKGKYKLKIIDKTGNAHVTDLLYGASSAEFVTWLKLKGRLYMPYYTGLQISPDERMKELELVAKAGKLSPEMTREGEPMEFDK